MRKIRYRRFLEIACLVMAIALIPALGWSAKRISMATAGTGGTLYPVGALMAEMINKTYPEYIVTAEATGGSVENIRLLEAGETDMATVGMDTAYRASIGEGKSFQGKKSTIVGLFNMYDQPVHFVVPKDSDIKSYSDIKGKRIAVGAPGSGNEDKCKIMLESIGITYKDFKPEFLSFSESCEAISDGHIDGTFIWAGPPNSSIMRLATIRPIKFVDVADWEAEKINNTMPYITTYNMAANIYKDVNAAKALSIMTGLIATPRLPEEDAYKIVKAIFENLGPLSKSHKIIEDYNFKNGPKTCIPLHPGAKRYFVEKGALK